MSPSPESVGQMRRMISAAGCPLTSVISIPGRIVPLSGVSLNRTTSRLSSTRMRNGNLRAFFIVACVSSSGIIFVWPQWMRAMISDVTARDSVLVQGTVQLRTLSGERSIHFHLRRISVQAGVGLLQHHAHRIEVCLQLSWRQVPGCSRRLSYGLDLRERNSWLELLLL